MPFEVLHGKRPQRKSWPGAVENPRAQCARTPSAPEVLRLDESATGAISAYDLPRICCSETEPQAKPPTIYQVRDFLLEQGFCPCAESTNSYVVCHLCSTSRRTARPCLSAIVAA